MIVDAGGGTIDISSYCRNQKESFEEIAAPQCSFVFITLKFNFFPSLYLPGHFRGSVFVTTNAKRFLNGVSLPNRAYYIIS